MLGRSRYLTCAGREIHFMEWGDAEAPPLIMWHGLARTGRDFDALAEVMARGYWVICPDTPGRGLSQWAVDRDSEYCYDSYGRTALSLCENLGIEQMSWIGTSMGGVLGITLAGGAMKGRITSMVINDVGPEIAMEGVERIVAYVGNPPVFDTIGELETWLRTVYVPFGDNPDGFWRTMTETSCRRMDDGRVTVHYDPAIVTQLTLHRADLDQWDAYDAIECPVLLLRGENSDVLHPDVAQAMVDRGPKVQLIEIPGFGHAPTLGSMHEYAVIKKFLET